MATGLAARIKDIFGVTPRLVEGHDGIYEIMIDGQTAVTNKNKCSGIPSEDEILQEIRKYLAPLPGKENLLKAIIPLFKVSQ